MDFLAWWLNAGVTPLTIPNREVKPGSTDGTRKGRVGSRQTKVSNIVKVVVKCVDMKKYIFAALFLAIFLTTPALAQTSVAEQIKALQTQISELTAQLNQLMAQQNQIGDYCYQFDKDLSIGSTGSGTLHQVLNISGLGNFNDQQISGNAKFDDQTLIAVKKFQAKHGLPQTGYVGPLTRAKLNELFGCGNNKFYITPSVLEAAQIWPYPNVKSLYNQPLTVHGLAGDISWAVIGGSLPPGFSLTKDPVPAPMCVPVGSCLVGPTSLSYRAVIGGFTSNLKVGTYTFTVQASSGTQTATQTYTLSVLSKTETATSTITVTSPNGGEQWRTYDVQDLTWDYSSASSADRVDLFLEGKSRSGCEAGAGMPCLPVMPEMLDLDKNIAARSSSYSWIVGTDINNKVIVPGAYKVVVCKSGYRYGSKECDRGDNYFTILAPVASVACVQEKVATHGSSQYAPGELIVGFTRGTTLKNAQNIIQTMGLNYKTRSDYTLEQWQKSFARSHYLTVTGITPGQEFNQGCVMEAHPNIETTQINSIVRAQ